MSEIGLNMELIAFYGTLMRGCRGLEYLGVDEHKARFISECLIYGRLYTRLSDNGKWLSPILLEEPGQVEGELYEVDTQSLASLDSWESYCPDNPESSEYLRKRVRLINPAVEAWVYIYNYPERKLEAIDSWRSFREINPLAILREGMEFDEL